MKIEICDLCHKHVHETNRTKVIIEDHKGMTFEIYGVFPAKRKFAGVICDECLERLRHHAKEEE